MPRPRSELTKNRRFVGIWLTPEQHEMWNESGKRPWLSKLLDEKLAEKEKNRRRMYDWS